MTDQHLHPSTEQFEAFKALPRDKPIDMLNLVRFKDKADYPKGHELAGKDMSGKAAYAVYSQTSGVVFNKVGGKIIWGGEYETMVIGPDGEKYHSVFVARYPDAHAFLAMVSDPEYQKAVINRTAAVETSRLIRVKPNMSQSGTFG